MFTPAQWAIIAFTGASSAVIYGLTAFGSFGGLLLAYFSQLPLFIIGLGMGLTAGAVAGAIGSLGVLMMGGLVGAGVFIAFNAAPVIFIVRQALLSRTNEKGDTEWYPPGLLVSTSAVAAGVLMLATLVWLDLTQSGAETAIRTYVEHVAGAMFPDLTGDKRVMLAEGVTPFGPGLIAVSWLLMLAVNGSLAQGLLTRVERNLRPSPDFALTALPRWFPGVAALAVLGAAIFGGSIGFYAQNLALLAALPFFFVGLAVVHVFCRRVTAGPLLLILFYIVMMVFGWPALFVAFIGLLEQLTGLRQRLAGPGEEV